MADIGDILKGNTVTGAAIGLGVVILAPVVVPIVASVVKPVAKAAIKGGIVLYDMGRGVVAETVETAEDLVAEARAELGEGGESAAVITKGQVKASPQPS
ncbi:MAG: DUF5132 domain-containing protein [Actinobacteria bacterium]|nr:DUF5132 domain-containing protein [Actinomycetota bacterium]